VAEEISAGPREVLVHDILSFKGVLHCILQVRMHVRLRWLRLQLLDRSIVSNQSLLGILRELRDRRLQL